MLNKDEGVIEPFKVFVRIRPLSEKEKSVNDKSNSKQRHKINSILVNEDNLLFVLDPDSLDLNVRIYY